MLQKAQEARDTTNDEEHQTAPTTANQIPATRKRHYFKGSGGSQRTKVRKRSVHNSSFCRHSSSSQNPVMPEGGPSAVTDGPVSLRTPTALIQVSDDDDDDDDVEDIVESLDDGNKNDKFTETLDDYDPLGKMSTASDYRMNMSCDGRANPLIQVATTAATEDIQNYWAVLDVKLPGHLYEVLQIAKSLALNSRISRISGAMVPGSSVESSSSSTSLHPSVDGSNYGTSLRSSVDGSNSSTSLHPSVYGSSSSTSVHSSASSSLTQPFMSGNEIYLLAFLLFLFSPHKCR
jgi:type II secretory pathway component GspD/PulD (secretin)